MLGSISQKQLDIIHQLLALDATIGARAFLQKTNIIARHAGEALFNAKIWPQKHNNIFWNHTEDRTCYMYTTPVKIEGKLYFVLPGIKDLTTDSPILPCHHDIIAYFRSENEKLKWIYNYQKHAQQWSTVNGKATVIEVPVEVAWTKQWELFTFHANELFHDEELGLQSAIGIIQSKFWEISQIQRSLNHLVNYTATTSIDPALFHRVYTATTNTFLELGHSLQNLGGGLLNGFYQALINIALTPWFPFANYA